MIKPRTELTTIATCKYWLRWFDDPGTRRTLARLVEERKLREKIIKLKREATK